jgi:hypothetical protein
MFSFSPSVLQHKITFLPAFNLFNLNPFFKRHDQTFLIWMGGRKQTERASGKYLKYLLFAITPFYLVKQCYFLGIVIIAIFFLKGLGRKAREKSNNIIFDVYLPASRPN